MDGQEGGRCGRVGTLQMGVQNMGQPNPYYHLRMSGVEVEYPGDCQTPATPFWTLPARGVTEGHQDG